MAEIIRDLIEIADNKPYFLKSAFADLFDLTQKLVLSNQIEDEKIKEMMLELILSLVLSYSKLFEEDEAKFSAFLELVLYSAIQFEDEISEKWMNPEREEVDEFVGVTLEESIESAKNIIDRLIKMFPKATLQILGQKVRLMLDDENWKHKYTGIVLLGSISHKMDYSDISGILKPMLVFSSNENPKIRFGIIYFLTKATISYEKKMVSDFFEELYQHSLNCLDDTVLKVQIAVCELLEKLVYACECKRYMPFLQSSLDKVFTFYLNQIPLVLKERLLSVLSNIIATAGKEIQPYFDKCMEILTSGMQEFLQIDKKICGRVIEVVILLGKMNVEYFENIVPSLVDYLIVLQDSIDTSEDKLFHFISYGWDNTVPVVCKKYPTYIKPIIESSVKLVSKISMVESPEAKYKLEAATLEEEKADIKTHALSDASESIFLVKTIIENTGLDFAPYLEFTDKTVLPLIEFEGNSDIRNAAAEIVVELGKLHVKLNHAECNATLKRYIECLIKALLEEIDMRALTSQLEGLTELLKAKENYLNQAELEIIYLKVVELLGKYTDLRKKIEKRRDERETEIENDNPEGDPDLEEDFDEELCELEQEVEEMERMELGIAESFKDLLSQNKESGIKIVEHLAKTLIPKYFGSNSAADNRVGLFIMEDVMEVMGHAQLEPVWNQFCETIFELALSLECQLRQAAAFGLGLIAKMTEGDFTEYAAKIIKIIDESLNFNDDGEDEVKFNHARDNTISALGKLIFYKSSAIQAALLPELVDKWLHLLPLSYDEEENEINLDFVLKLLNSEENLIFSQEKLVQRTVQVILSCQLKNIPKTKKEEIKQTIVALTSKHTALVEKIRSSLPEGLKQVLLNNLSD